MTDLTHKKNIFIVQIGVLYRDNFPCVFEICQSADDTLLSLFSAMNEWPRILVLKLE